jgi:hypothetical protein
LVAEIGSAERDGPRWERRARCFSRGYAVSKYFVADELASKERKEHKEAFLFALFLFFRG